jgi:hypothetical protein
VAVSQIDVTLVSYIRTIGVTIWETAVVLLPTGSSGIEVRRRY